MNHINSLHVTPSVDVFTSIAVNDSGDDSDDPEWLDGLVAKKIKKRLVVSAPGSIKLRKQYSIQKARQNWDDEDHTRFLLAIALYARNWKRISQFVGNKSVIQCRSHAQKYYAKIATTSKPVDVSDHTLVPKPVIVSSQEAAAQIMNSVDISPQYQSILSDATYSDIIASSELAEWSTDRTVALKKSSLDIVPTDKVFSRVPFIFKKQIDATAPFVEAVSILQSGGPDYSVIYSFLSEMFASDFDWAAKMNTLSVMRSLERQVVQMLMHNAIENLKSPDLNSLILVSESTKPLNAIGDKVLDEFAIGG